MGRSDMLGIYAEDLPDEANRVVLDPTKADAFGIPAAKILYRLSDNSQQLVAFHQARARESLQAAGAYETVVAPFIRATGWHLLGTAMMGSDPVRSVVGPSCRSHGVENLFIFDS